MSQTARAVGRYELLEVIGRGGMAVVYRARQSDLKRFVAVKELASFRAPDAELARRFVAEARLAGSLNHQNVVTVIDFFEYAGTPYIAMEYLPRGSLRPQMHHLSLAQIGGVLEGLLAGLAHAAELSIIHRDIKPENLLVTGDGRIKIADFGIAKALGTIHSGGYRTATELAIGTPAYMAPEQAMGRKPGPTTDLYAVGVIAFELFTGSAPFTGGESPVAIMYRHVNETIPPVSSVNPAVDPAISAWIAALLRKDPKQRTQLALEAWEQFEEIIIELLGPRWRRHAAIGDANEPVAADAYVTFAGDPPYGHAVGQPATPPPGDLPSGPLMPAPGPTEPEVVVASVRPQSMPGSAAVDVEAGDRAKQTSTGASRSRDAGDEITVPPRHAPRRRPRRRLVVAVVLAAGLAATAGVAALVSTPSATATRTLASGPVSVLLPPGWKSTPTPPDTRALELTADATASPGGDPARGTVTVGMASRSAHNATLLSDAFRGSLTSSPDARQAVMRGLPGGLQAFRYDTLLPRKRTGTFTVYASPTTGGVATVACSSPISSSTCDAVARTLDVTDVNGFAVGASPAYGDSVNRMLRRLSFDLGQRRANLFLARSTRAQASAATAIASAHGVGARALEEKRPSPADERSHTRLIAALREARDAYTGLAAAAGRSRRQAYRSAARDARRAQAKIAAIVRDLQDDGYRRLITRHYDLRRIPSLLRAATVAPPPPPPAAQPSPQPAPVPPPIVAPPPPPPQSITTPNY